MAIIPWKFPMRIIYKMILKFIKFKMKNGFCNIGYRMNPTMKW